MRRLAAVSAALRLAAVSSALLLALGLALAGEAQPQTTGRPGEVLVREMVSVTGTIRLAPQRAGRGSALEIDSGAMGRYRVAEFGLGEALKQHVDEDVTVVAFVEPFEQDGRPVLRIARFRLHEG